MSQCRLHLRRLAGALLVGVVPVGSCFADDTAADHPKPVADAPDSTSAQAEIPTYNLLDAMRDGLVAVDAEGRSDGRMTMSVTNTSSRKLRVVLPPGLVAQGAAGQMMGGMGGMGGGMGGMGGGMMGGMGGGMGGMGRMGGGMGGRMGGRGGGTMSPMMGMMMLGRMIMMLCGDYDSWDQRSLMMGMMGGGMGGMGMGGMGGGMMGGMGGGMGGMGMGMRSVPPTSLPFAEVKPGQTRSLPTRLVSLSNPDANGRVQLPAEGEKLQLGDVSQVNADPKVQKALKLLAAEKANNRVSQMVMWRVASGLQWDAIARLAQEWGNSYELTLAQSFVDRLDETAHDEAGVIRFQVDPADPADQALAAEATATLKDKPVLGLWAREGVPAEPLGPAIACRVRLKADEATVLVSSSNATAQSWVPYGKFTVPVVRKDGKFDAAGFADGLAEGVLNKMVRARVSKGAKAKGKSTYTVRIDNASPLMLNGLAVLGVDDKDDAEPRRLAGFSISPRRSMTVPATEAVAKQLGVNKAARLVAADLSSL